MLIDLLLRGWYFENDGSNAGGTDDSAEAKAEKKDEKAEAKAGDDAEKGKAKEEKKFSQAELDQIVKDRLERAQKKADTDAAKAAKTAEEEALKKNQEWQKLAETRAAEIATLTKEKTDLEPFKEQAEKYKKALDDILAAQKKKLPKHILTLIEKLDPVDAMAYITENAEALGAKLETYGETPEAKEKKVSDDDKKKSQEASTGIITRSF